MTGNFLKIDGVMGDNIPGNVGSIEVLSWHLAYRTSSMSSPGVGAGRVSERKDIEFVAKRGWASLILCRAYVNYEYFPYARLVVLDGGNVKYTLAISGVHVEFYGSSPPKADVLDVLTLSGRVDFVKGIPPGLTVRSEHADLIREARGRARLS